MIDLNGSFSGFVSSLFGLISEVLEGVFNLLSTILDSIEVGF